MFQCDVMLKISLPCACCNRKEKFQKSTTAMQLLIEEIGKASPMAKFKLWEAQWI
jgi:hypothetical protein